MDPHTVAKFTIVALKVTSVSFGFIGAVYWYKSATTAAPSIEHLNSFIGTGEERAPLQNWLHDAATKNELAAGLTAVSIAASAIASLIETFA